jgi:hypothetical protein
MQLGLGMIDGRSSKVEPPGYDAFFVVRPLGIGEELFTVLDEDGVGQVDFMVIEE